MICSGPSKGIGSVLMIERLVPVHLECALCGDRTQCLVVPKQTAWQNDQNTCADSVKSSFSVASRF